MRISDWSSDVCSSDLVLKIGVRIPSETQEKAPFRGAFLCLKGRQQKRGPGTEQARRGQCVWGRATQQLPSETQEKAPCLGAIFESEAKHTIAQVRVHTNSISTIRRGLSAEATPLAL